MTPVLMSVDARQDVLGQVVVSDVDENGLTGGTE